jgi:3-methyl-2-oxobutanoate hydroxymethyltransferase
MSDAHALQEAGAFCLVMEMVPGPLAAEVTASLSIPTIGIGAGPHCDGQVLVCNDMLGLDARFKPRFVKRYAELESPIIGAFRSYVDEVRAGTFPTREHAFGQRGKKSKVTRLY